MRKLRVSRQMRAGSNLAWSRIMVNVLYTVAKLGIVALALAGSACTIGSDGDPESPGEGSSSGSGSEGLALEAPGAPNFQAPFPCGESWTYSHHSAEVRLALDFIANGGGSNGRPVLASAGGTATRHYQAGGAGNYIVVSHGGGWQTYYFHLSSYSVGNNVQVRQGQEVGRVGSTGASSGPHLHYEQLLNGGGQYIVIAGQRLSPYPGTYGQRSITSQNCGGGGTTCGNSPATIGKIDEKYRALGGCGSFLGVPITEERITPDGVGRYSVFERGSIYWTPSTGAFEVHGMIRDKWAELGWEPGVLGYPITDETPTPDGIGRYNVFQGGSIYWTPDTGAHEVRGRIRDKWAELGWEAGALGYPISGEYAVTAGRKSDFQHGSITWDEDSDEFTVTMN